MHGILKPKCGQQHTRQSVFSLSGLSWTRKCQRAGELVSWFGGGVSSNCFFTYLSAGLLPQCSGFCLFHTQTRTHKVFWEKVQLPWWEWLMTPFTAQTPHNQRCWGSICVCLLSCLSNYGRDSINPLPNNQPSGIYLLPATMSPCLGSNRTWLFPPFSYPL